VVAALSGATEFAMGSGMSPNLGKSSEKRDAKAVKLKEE
jgi:hypothetical protein